MSADGYGLLAATALVVVAAPVVIAGAAAIGAVYGAAKLVKNVADRHQRSEALRREQERKKQAELASKNAEERRRIDALLSDFSLMQERQAQERRAQNERFTSALLSASKELDRARSEAGANLNRLMEDFERRNTQLFSDWKNSTEQLQATYSARIKSSVSSMKRRLEQGKREIEALRLQHDDGRKRAYAKDQIEAAKDVVLALEAELGVSVDSFVRNLDRAVDYYNKGMYENAYSIAASVMDECYTALEKGLNERERVYSLLDQLEAKATLQKARIDAVRNFDFNYRGERYEEDLTRFSPELFSAVSRRISEIENRFENPNLPSLLAASHDLDEVKGDVDDIIKLSVAKLLYAYTENDTAADITEAMCAQGFEVEGYAYENDVEGNAIHINYYNSISRERVTVVLAPSPDGIKVSVHNYGDVRLGTQQEATRQDSIRALIENTLNIPISCSNRGAASTHTQAADLQRVKRLGGN